MRSKSRQSHPSPRGARKKRRFIRKTLKRLVTLGALGVGVRYFTDSDLGATRRSKVQGLLGKLRP